MTVVANGNRAEYLKEDARQDQQSDAQVAHGVVH